MHYKHGLFFPDNFPWPCDHAIAILHKTAVMNGVCGRVVLGTVPLTLAARRHTKNGREMHIESVLEEMYGSTPGYSRLHSSVNFATEYFPKSVFGPIKYCAQCLAETGLVPAIFSLRLVASCPWHHQPLKPLCKRCHDIWRFIPTPFGSPVGYRCADCGYWVPNRRALFAVCRSYSNDIAESACFHFLTNTLRLQRLGVLDVLHFSGLTDGRVPALADCGVIPEFTRDNTSKVWYRTLDLSGGGAAPGSPEECYQRFVRFHQMHLLKAHRDCPCGAVLSRPDFGEASRSMCVYSVALSIFRQKFESPDNAEAVTHLAEAALEQLAELQMAPRVARCFFQCTFYQLIARLWFWSRAASRFVVHIDPRHFWGVLDTGRSPIRLARLLGEGLQGRYSCEFDLPADRAAMRQLMGPAQFRQTLRIRNLGTRAELTAPATPRLFYGTLPATAMFYF